ncbi:long tail fiber proximal subunit [Providencia phage PSTCR6]|nr:long tail fiber proximal subunit [Providencia phage PSTCR6]
MAENKSFRATYGLDASNQKVINVAKADKTVLTDGVNVDFFIEENTIQKYDETRGYSKDFAVIFEGRVYFANRDIPKPAGTFDPVKWTHVRVDPKWISVINTPQDGYNLESGNFITADTNSNELLFNLPKTPKDGDTIAIKDIGGYVGYKSLRVKKSIHDIKWNDLYRDEIYITRPYSQTYFIFSRGLWNALVLENEDSAKIVSSQPIKQKLSSGDRVYRRSSTGKIDLVLPKYAMHGDLIEFYDIDSLTPINHMTVEVSEDSGHSVELLGQTSVTVRTSGSGRLAFDGSENIWRVWEGDLRTRLKLITENYKILPNEAILVFGANNSEKKTITIDLPKDVELGDTVEISLNYMRKGQKVNIKASTGDTISTSKSLLQFPKRSEYPPETAWVTVPNIEFDGTLDYVPYIRLSYVLQNGKTTWIIQEVNPTVERVDSTARERLGVIALASQAQANVDKEKNPEKELAITPETLANRVALETRRGIARIATTAEVNKLSVDSYDDDTIITPKKLNGRSATETRRGLAELATQEKTNKGEDDLTIVTPKKLHNRKASETLTGIAKIVASKGTPGTQRDVPGTGVYSFNNNTDIVTPAALHENLATKTALGTVFLATETEVIEAPVMDPKFPVVVTPVELHKKTATESRIGFAKIATQDETNKGAIDNAIVTPKKLNDRKASETLTGIARIATQTEFNQGTLNDVISSPLKVKTYFNSTARIQTNTATGIKHTGTLWENFKLEILPASELQVGSAKIATKALVDAGTDDTTIVTPKKLHDKKSTETSEGIIKVSTYEQTIAGTSANTAISPKNFVLAIRTEKNGLEATTTNRGFVRITQDASIWTGDDVVGSTGTYEHDGYAVSPRELNKALSHYLPIKATAVNSALLNGIKSDQFIRRDINQEVNGILTMNKETVMKAPLNSTSTGKFTTLDLTSTGISLKLGNSTGWSGLHILGQGGWSLFSASDTNFKIQPIDAQNPDNIEMFSINRTSGNVDIAKNLNVGGVLNAFSVQVRSKDAIRLNGTRILYGNNTTPLQFATPNASDIVVSEAVDQYKVITTKNLVEESNKTYLRKGGDTATGTINFSKPIFVRRAPVANSKQSPENGIFVSEVVDKSMYDTYPGIAVPQYDDQNKITEYKYVKGPGTLIQIGDSKDFTFRIWVPKALDKTANHNNHSIWMQTYNTAKGELEDWGRVFTTQSPPTAADVGAVSESGSSINNITVREWMQVGNLRLVPNPVTKTVDYIWVD